MILRLFDKSSLEKLGLLPSRKRLINFLAGLVIACVCSAIYFESLALLSKSSISINKHYSLPIFLSSFWWISRSVLFEEFLFRGVLLYIAAKHLGAKTACILSAIAFGVYHWFSYGILGNIAQMAFIFLLTGVAGLLFAYCFVRTQSMYLQTALHLGWNLISIVVFSQGPLPTQLLEVTKGIQIGVMFSILLFLFQLLSMPVVTAYYLNRRFNISRK
jgi:hypothetical protein